VKEGEKEGSRERKIEERKVWRDGGQDEGNRWELQQVHGFGR
jgi:hypothetical protein